MFATLLGALPAPPPGSDPLDAVLEAQVASGLEPLTDGRGAQPPTSAVVAAWRATAARTDRPVKAVLVGPWSAAVRAAEAGSLRVAPLTPSDLADVLARAEQTRDCVAELAAAGCPLVEIEEREAHRIGEDTAFRSLFREAHLALVGGPGTTHRSLSIVGGSAWEAGAATILDAPYHSLAVDLIAGPENWRLVAVTPAERGIVAGGLDPTRSEGPELLVWAAHYAASTRGRGLARVGLGTGGSLAHLSWDQALLRMRTLGEAARIATLPPGEAADHLDPRAVSSRAAATGRTRHAEGRRRKADDAG